MLSPVLLLLLLELALAPVLAVPSSEWPKEARVFSSCGFCRCHFP